MTVEIEERTDPPSDGNAVTVQRRGTSPMEEATVRRLRRAALGAGAFAIVAGIALAWQTSRPDAEPSTAVATATARDQVVIAASEAVETLNTLDHRDVPAGLGAWESVTTGALHDQVAGIDAKRADALASGGAVSSARVVDAAVVELDAAAGSAALIAFVEVTVDPRSGTDTVKRYQYSVDMRRIDDRWLVAALTPTGLEQ